MNIKKPEIAVPDSMRSLEMTDLGYLKPWFVKADDFRIVDTEKAKRARAKELCWISGKPWKEKKYALIGSPLSAMFRVFREPPCQVDCAEYALQVCPFILYPNSKRRTAGLEPHQQMGYINDHLDIKYDPINPGEYYLVIVSDFTYDEEKAVIRCKESDVIERQYWIGGERQSEIPDPIVSYSELPEDLREKYTEAQFKQRYSKSSHAPPLKVIEHESFKSKAWSFPVNFSFAASDSTITVGLKELETAASFLPTAFIKEGESFKLVALTSLLPGRNFFIDRELQWRLPYVPQAYRTFPFRIGRTENGESKLCFDMRSDLLNDSSDLEQNSRFFEEDGSLTKQLRDIGTRLLNLTEDVSRTARVVEALASYSLVKPWNLELQNQAKNKSRKITGLYCIDEESLNAIDAIALAELRNIGGLKLAYLQLHSMQHILKFSPSQQ